MSLENPWLSRPETKIEKAIFFINNCHKNVQTDFVKLFKFLNRIFQIENIFHLVICAIHVHFTFNLPFAKT